MNQTPPRVSPPQSPLDLLWPNSLVGRALRHPVALWVRRVVAFWVQVLFWIFNISFTIVALFGIFPEEIIPLIKDIFTQRGNFEILWPLILWSLLGPLFLIIGFIRMRHDAWGLFSLLLGLEIPMFWALLGRLTQQQFSGAASVLVVLMAISLIATTLSVASGKNAPLWLHPFSITLAICGTVLASMLLLSILLPELGVITLGVIQDIIEWNLSLYSVFKFFIIGSFSLLSFWLFFFVPLIIYATLFWPMGAPFAWVWLAASSSLRTYRRAPRFAVVSSVVTAVGCTAWLCATWHQPQLTAFARLAPHANAIAAAQAQDILDDEASIRDGLVHAYLASHRTVTDHIQPWQTEWNRLFNRIDHTVSLIFGPSTQPRDWVSEETTIADLLNRLLGPFVYQGNYEHDRVAARQLYATVFGEDIERSEREAIRDALGANVMARWRADGFANEGAQHVHLVAQDVTIQRHAGYATVEIHDEWQNLTSVEREVKLGFSLPASAAFDELLLSNSGDRSTAFVGQLSPRGAAQQVYNEQKQRSQDPALLEQVGPMQYRLRIFPILPETAATPEVNWRSSARTAPHMHSWVRYHVPFAADGSIPMPQLLERQSAFWSSYTKRTVDGVEQDATATEQWVQAPAAEGGQPASLRGKAGDSCFVWAPAAKTTAGALAGKRVRVAIDTSYSMKSERNNIQQALLQLQQTGAELDIYQMSTSFKNEPTRKVTIQEADQFIALGATSPKLMLRELMKIHAPADAIVMLAGKSSFDLADDSSIAAPAVPTVVVHVGTGLPRGYDDAMLDALAISGGTVVQRIEDAVALLSKQQVWVDGFALSEVPCLGDESVHPIVSRMVVRHRDRARAQRDVEMLDAQHQVAKAANVVTPYSSLIALVDDAQRQRLAELEQAGDRFQREVERPGGTPSSSNLDFINGAPEPTTWALLCVMSGAAYWQKRRRRTV